MTNRLPIGEQIELRAGEHHVVVTEVGAGLRSYMAGDHAVLDGYGADEMASDGRGQVLMPWPNRIQDGAYQFGGTWHHLPINEREAGNTIHGLVRWDPWLVAERDASSVALEHTLCPQPGYPFSLDLGIEYAVPESGLRVTSRATNPGRGPCPYESGAHPYLGVGTATVDTVTLLSPGRTVLRTDAPGLPVGTEPVEGTEYDFREPRPVAATKLDHAFTELERDDDGLARVELQDPEGETELTVWLGEGYPYVQLFTGDPLPGSTVAGSRLSR